MKKNVSLTVQPLYISLTMKSGIVTEFIKVFEYSNDKKNAERNKALPAYLST